MDELIKKIREYLLEGNNKKFINNLFIILLVSVIFLIVVNNNLVGRKKVETKKEGENIYSPIIYNEEDYSIYLEKKLESILGQLKGVGRISTMITLEESVEKVTATNTTITTENTRENDSTGGTREVNREDTTTQVITKGNDGSLLIIKEVNPNIKGVIVVAEGAEDPQVMEELYTAVKTVLGIPGNRVEIYSSK